MNLPAGARYLQRSMVLPADAGLPAKILPADLPRLLGQDRFVYGDKPAMFYGDFAVHHGVVHGAAQADRSEEILRVIVRADQLQTAAVHQKEIGILPG